jgi:putative addiction module component (TIGR02574 family)
MGKQELIDEIMKLDVADREHIYGVLSVSLADELSPQLSAEDQQEILRRVERFDKNPETFIPWDQVKANLKAQRERSGK